MSLLTINNIFISDNNIKCQINNNGIKLLNGAYVDKFNLPYIINGLQFNNYNNNLMVDKLIDNKIKNIIIPDNSYYKNEDNLLTTKIITKVNLNLTSNNKYIFINNTIEDLTLTSNEEIHIILSTPLKNFNVSLTNIIIDYLIIREYHENLFDENIINKFNFSKLINLTRNETNLLFDKYVLSSLIEVYNKIPNEDYFKYIIFDSIPKLKNLRLYFKFYDKQQITTLTNYQLIISNINLGCYIDYYNNKIIYYRGNNVSDSFDVEYNFISLNEIIIYNHYALLNADNKWFQYDFYNNTYNLLVNNNNGLIEIDNNIYSYVKNGNNVILTNIKNQQTKSIPLLSNSTLLNVIRCFNDIVLFCQIGTDIYIIFSSYVLESFNYIKIINDYNNNFQFNFSYKDEIIIIEYQNLNSVYQQLKFYAYNIMEQLMRI